MHPTHSLLARPFLSISLTALTVLIASAAASSAPTTALFSAAITPASTAATPPAAAAPAAPKTLPAFSLPDLDGKVHASKEWQGKVVVLDFWATWCVSCRETIPLLRQFKTAYGDKGLVVAGISMEAGPKEKIAKFARKMKMDYQILWDSEDSMSKLFGFEGLPSVFIFDREGNLLKAMPQYTSERKDELTALVDGQFRK
ncbi:MAG: TlpA disulfide reductase family protein [Fibrobacteria bacterium]